MRTCAFAIMIIFTAFSCGSDSKKHTIADKEDKDDKMEQEQERLRYLALPKILKMLKEE
jgi:hypothetical protein